MELAHQVPGILSNCKHELLPNHESHLITHVVQPVWLVQATAPGQTQQAYSHRQCQPHVCSHTILPLPNSNHVLISLQGIFQESSDNTWGSSIDKGINGDQV